MLQSVKLTKSEYARCYDDIADELYRLALYLLGDDAQARYAMAELFVKGFALCTKENFEQRMLAVLCQVVKDCQPVCGEQYRNNMLSTVMLRPEDGSSEQLFGILGKISFVEREILLFSVLQKQPPDIIAWLLDISQGEVSRVIKHLCNKVRCTMAA